MRTGHRIRHGAPFIKAAHLWHKKSLTLDSSSIFHPRFLDKCFTFTQVVFIHLYMGFMMKPSEYSRVLWENDFNRLLLEPCRRLKGSRFCQTSYSWFSVELSRLFLTWRRKTTFNPAISRLPNRYRTERIVLWWGNESFCGCCDAPIKKKKCIHHVPAAFLLKWTSASSDLGFQNKTLLLSRSSFPVCRETINATRHSVSDSYCESLHDLNTEALLSRRGIPAAPLGGRTV